MCAALVSILLSPQWKLLLNDLLFTPAPFSFPPRFVERALTTPGGTRERERLRAPCDDQRVLERPWQPIICLLVASCLASHFSGVPFLIFLPGELFHVWNGLVVFLCPDMLRESDSDRSALCLLGGKNLRRLVFQPCVDAQMYQQKKKCLSRFQNQRRLVTEEEFSCTFSPPPLSFSSPSVKFPIKNVPRPGSVSVEKIHEGS